ncbi:ABC transporter substrate-binding protein [Amycolatopsis benzoatilytica]|uniref:ABC transporter substrate-binding protein n=1 Tax=Amycolatopsis benzoatilytica TaxID=346045 RepID=UPI0003655523|nr:ABC transporter substrate-binding protein [Amycolatopsis benzoatilytica]
MDQTTAPATEPLAFAGADRLVKLVGALYQRPRIGDRPRDLRDDGEWRSGYHRERTGRRGLPMVCLVGDAREGVLEELSVRLQNAKPAGSVRSVRLSLADSPDTDAPGDATTASVEAVRDILWRVRNALVHSGRTRESRLRFPLFTLVDQLMARKFPDDDTDPERTLLRELQENGLLTRFRSALDNVSRELVPQHPTWRFPLLLLRWLTIVTFRIAVTGRVPGLSGRYRWFLRQPHLAPEMSGSFVRFALRLTDGEWQKESPEFVARLLVNAFLEDLRRDYLLRPWQFWRRHRMTYPVLLLDEVSTANGGYRLLELINDVRNQVGLFDPLLVVSASQAPPPDAAPSVDRPKYHAGESASAYRVWQNMLSADRRARRPTAWYLPIGLDAPQTETEKAEVRKRVLALGDSYERSGGRMPLWATRWLRAGLPALLLVSVAGVGGLRYSDFRDSHCGTSSQWLTWVEADKECIGVSDGSYPLFSPADPEGTIHQVEGTIAVQNQQAADLHAQQPDRPYITLVDLEALTSSNGTPEGLTAERESLEGFAVAQSRQLDATATAEPIMRVLIANGGKGMRHGADVAKTLLDLAKQDPTLVGVVGLDMSSEPTSETIRALGDAGIPVVAATLSADQLADQNPIYFQVAPQNRREAAVAASFFAQRPGPRAVRVYYSDDATDYYSLNLRDDLLKSFGEKHFAVEARAFVPDEGQVDRPAHQHYGDREVGNASAAGRDTCSYDGIAFFAGRGVPDFGAFLAGAAQCGSAATLIGDDDVSRYVADTVARERNRALPYYYLALASQPVTTAKGPARDFYATLNAKFDFERTVRGRSFDGHAALSYDAALVMITATAYLRETSSKVPVTPGAVWREITAIHTSRPDVNQTNKYIEGASGAIDYGGDIGRHVPQEKPVAVLQVQGGEVVPALQGFCGKTIVRQSDQWCPADS